jgi:hypothetical protein
VECLSKLSVSVTLGCLPVCLHVTYAGDGSVRLCYCVERELAQEFSREQGPSWPRRIL